MLFTYDSIIEFAKSAFTGITFVIRASRSQTVITAIEAIFFNMYRFVTKAVPFLVTCFYVMTSGDVVVGGAGAKGVFSRTTFWFCRRLGASTLKDLANVL